MIQLSHSTMANPTREEVSEAHSNAIECWLYLDKTNINCDDIERDIEILEENL